MSRLRTPIIAFLAILLYGSGADASKNWYEWSGVAPIVVVGENLGKNGKYHDVRVREVLRGTLDDDVTIAVDVRRANRARSLNVDPKPLKLEPGVVYVWLLADLPEGHRRGHRSPFDLVRGVRGAREVPAETRESLVAALRRFVFIQDQKSEVTVWREFESMLEEPAPVFVRTALEQYLKFRRGTPELVLALRPLLDHPDDRIREFSAALSQQILRRFGQDRIPEIDGLRGDLVSLARRDPAIDVRIAATEALAELPSVTEILETIAQSDPEQNVRFTAQKRLLALKKGPQ